MKIAVNTRLLIKGNMGGMGWFTYQTMKRITQNHPEHHFFFLFDRKWDDEFIFSDNITPIRLFPPARHPFLWYVWFEKSVTRFLKNNKPDLFLSTDGFLSLGTDVPSVAVIHDINFFHLRANLPYFVKEYYLRYFPRFAEKANRIATVSEYSKNDIVTCYNINPKKIDVVYNGSDEVFEPLSDEQKLEIRQQYAGGNEYFIFIGSLIPRKNLCRMLEAFDLFKKGTGKNHKLIIIGDQLFRFCPARKTHAAMQYKDDVIFAGKLHRSEIKLILAASKALIFVPYFEGFGIPILEAFRCDIPVVAGDRTSLPEVGGDAALYVDPFSIESITNGMKKIDNDDNLRIDLINKGRIQLKKFSWEKSAALLWHTIKKTLHPENYLESE